MIKMIRIPNEIKKSFTASPILLTLISNMKIPIIFKFTNMFIKKDRRKIDEILREEGSKIETLKLSKRAAEFQGSIKIICHELKVKILCNLRVLNLYDNALTNVDGIGILSQTPIEDLSLGCNKLTKLPLEVYYF